MANTPTNLYGRDLACTPDVNGILDLTDAMTEVTGIDLLAQSILRRHLTLKGSDIASPNDGIDIRTLIKEGLTQEELSTIAVTVQQELIRDQRVLPSTTVVGSFNQSTLVLTLTEIIQTSSGPFSLTITVDQVTVALLVGPA